MGVGLRIRLFGPLRVLVGDERLTLPASRKTRALLAYLALTGREHPRERLCALLWPDVDDPRGALRWSVSRLRRLLSRGAPARIVATREAIGLDARAPTSTPSGSGGSSSARWRSWTPPPSRTRQDPSRDRSSRGST